jgi:hypothetical protein
MTDAQWTEAEREAVAFSQREAWRDEADIRDETLNWPDIEDEDREAWLKGADAALSALAPFVSKIEAAAFKRGAEAMRTDCATIVDAHAAAAKRCSEESDVIYRIRAEFLANFHAITQAADDVRVTPLPEHKP